MCVKFNVIILKGWFSMENKLILVVIALCLTFSILTPLKVEAKTWKEGTYTCYWDKSKNLSRQQVKKHAQYYNGLKIFDWKAGVLVAVASNVKKLPGYIKVGASVITYPMIALTAEKDKWVTAALNNNWAKAKTCKQSIPRYSNGNYYPITTYKFMK